MLLFSASKSTVTLGLSYSRYAQRLFSDLKHLIYINAMLMFLVLYLVQLYTDTPIVTLLFSRFGTIFSLQAIHAVYQYSLQPWILRYGFLEHDDYSVNFSTFDLSLGYMLALPFLSYAATVIFSLVVIVGFKHVVSGGWLLYQVFSRVPKGFNYLRRYASAGLGLLFMAMLGAAYLMNLYYLFVCASLVLYWSVIISYTKLSAKRADPITEAKERHRSWLLTDSLLLNLILLSLHWDRFVIETWRFLDFERTFSYAYDQENFFTYPFFLYQVGILICQKDLLHATLLKLTVWPLAVVTLLGFLLCFDLVYRLRVLLSIGLIAASATLVLSTCLSLGEKHYTERYEQRKKLKQEKRLKKGA